MKTKFYSITNEQEASAYCMYLQDNFDEQNKFKSARLFVYSLALTMFSENQNKSLSDLNETILNNYYKHNTVDQIADYLQALFYLMGLTNHNEDKEHCLNFGFAYKYIIDKLTNQEISLIKNIITDKY